MTYTVKYYAGPYKGTRTVQADDSAHAIAKVRASIRKDMTLPMYSDGYKIVSNIEEETEETE